MMNNKNLNFNRLENNDLDEEQIIEEEEIEMDSIRDKVFKSRLADIIYQRKNIILVILVCFILWILKSGQPSQQVEYSTKSFPQFLVESINNLEQELPQKYVDVDQLESYPQLPFCVIVDKGEEKQIEESVRNQKYDNYKILSFDFYSKQRSNKPSNYYDLVKAIKQQCVQKSVLSFATEPLTETSLKIQNDYLQQNNAWVLYQLVEKEGQKNNSNERRKVTNKTNGVRILSVYNRVFQLIGKNDFNETNKIVLQKQFNPAVIMTALFELCRYFALPISADQLFRSSSRVKAFMYFDLNSQSKEQVSKRKPYQNMHSLVQNFERQNIKYFDSRRNQFKSSNKTLTQIELFGNRQNQLTHLQFERALQFQQIIYLPDNHSLSLLQIKRMEQKYQTGKYEKQLPLCIDINSNNNIPNERYKKVFESVLSQNYSNFHVVFTDDMSSDQTLNLTKKYLEQEMKFPSQKISYIRTLRRKYATYNILNAVFNYCPKDSILLLLDGDDQLIGKQVFKFVNAIYQGEDIWVMYNFFKTDQYGEGTNIQFQNNLKNYFGGRKKAFFFGHLRTFKVKLMRKVPLREHLDETGNFLDTLYDTAFQYPLFQLSGKKHGKYIKQTNLLYTKQHGNNDDSTTYKSLRRHWKHFVVSLRSPLKQLPELDSSEDEEVKTIFQKQKGIQFIEVK